MKINLKRGDRYRISGYSVEQLTQCITNDEDASAFLFCGFYGISYELSGWYEDED